MKQYLGIDIGGTAVKLGLVDEQGQVLARQEQSVSFDDYKTPILDTVLAAAQQFVADHPAELSGIGVSATGQIDSRKGIVAGTCGNLPNYIGSPIKASLEQVFHLPVTVANDANCMTLGEVWAGAAKGYTDVIGVTLGTGVGGGILTGGRLLEGARDWAASWAIAGSMRWTVCCVPAELPAAGSAMQRPQHWCAMHRPLTRRSAMAGRSLLRPKQGMCGYWLCWRSGSMRSHRVWPGWCISSIRS